MAVDNQVLLATILVVGLGYFFLKVKPGQQQLTVDDQKSLQRQNINSQIDQVDVILDEFKEDWSKRGNNAETTPITGDELTLLQGLERNIRRIDKETGRTRAFEGQDFDNYIKRRDNLYEAFDKYKKAIEIKPDHVGAHHNLALAYKEMGEFKKAIKSHQTAIKYEPENSLHYFYLSELKKDLLDSQTKNKIEKIIKNDNSTKNNIAYANYLLSRYEKKLKNYEEELNYLKKGHQYFFDSRKEKFKLAVKYCFDDLLQISKDAHISKLNNKDDYNVKPIFIIGVPRSGSTLVEKIIASGKKLIPVGEETSVLEDFFNNKILQKQSLDLGDVKSIRNELYDLYKQKGLISKKYDYIFTDKSLNNFFYLGLIREIYPSAKVINCRRDILSSIMSIFQNNLSALAWTHDLDNIFKYFNNYFEIIKRYNEVNPNIIYELKFEKLINNPEEESKKLMNYCELPWDKKCLEFYKRKDLFSKTASNIQVRKPIYKHPSDRYLPYKEYLNKYGKKYSWFN